MNEELKQIARRVNWFESPEKVLADVDRFLVYAILLGYRHFSYASLLPIQIIRVDIIPIQ